MASWPYNTAQWQRLRKAKLAAEPLCQPCEARGAITAANTVDHVTPINDGGDPFPAFDGLMSMCARCHNEKTAANDRQHSKPFARQIKGFDSDGNPVDQGDEWHTGGASNHEIHADRGPMGEIELYLVSGVRNRKSKTGKGVI